MNATTTTMTRATTRASPRQESCHPASAADRSLAGGPLITRRCLACDRRPDPVRGCGPLLYLVGAPVGRSGFAALAEYLADEYTVVTHDPRLAARCDHAIELVDGRIVGARR